MPMPKAVQAAADHRERRDCSHCGMSSELMDGSGEVVILVLRCMLDLRSRTAVAIHLMPEGLFRQEDYITHVRRRSITCQAFCLGQPLCDNGVSSAELHREGEMF